MTRLLDSAVAAVALGVALTGLLWGLLRFAH